MNIFNVKCNFISISLSCNLCSLHPAILDPSVFLIHFSFYPVYSITNLNLYLLPFSFIIIFTYSVILISFFFFKYFSNNNLYIINYFLHIHLRRLTRTKTLEYIILYSYIKAVSTKTFRYFITL